MINTPPSFRRKPRQLKLFFPNFVFGIVNLNLFEIVFKLFKGIHQLFLGIFRSLYLRNDLRWFHQFSWELFLFIQRDWGFGLKLNELHESVLKQIELFSDKGNQLTFQLLKSFIRLVGVLSFKSFAFVIQIHF